MKLRCDTSGVVMSWLLAYKQNHMSQRSCYGQRRRRTAIAKKEENCGSTRQQSEVNKICQTARRNCKNVWQKKHSEFFLVLLKNTSNTAEAIHVFLGSHGNFHAVND